MLHRVPTATLSLSTKSESKQSTKRNQIIKRQRLAVPKGLAIFGGKRETASFCAEDTVCSQNRGPEP